MISKELLSEVLGYPKNIPYGNEGKTYKLNIVSSPYINENGKPDDIYFQTDAPGLGVNLINVYKLVHKCKEYAYIQGYVISSGLTPVLGVNKDGWAEVFSSSTPLDGKLHTFKQLSEPEAIFKAAQWVLDNVKTTSLP